MTKLTKYIQKDILKIKKSKKERKRKREREIGRERESEREREREREIVKIKNILSQNACRIILRWTYRSRDIK